MVSHKSAVLTRWPQATILSRPGKSGSKFCNATNEAKFVPPLEHRCLNMLLVGVELLCFLIECLIRINLQLRCDIEYAIGCDGIVFMVKMKRQVCVCCTDQVHR